jgi:hypothetical protein
MQKPHQGEEGQPGEDAGESQSTGDREALLSGVYGQSLSV